MTPRKPRRWWHVRWRYRIRHHRDGYAAERTCWMYLSWEYLSGIRANSLTWSNSESWSGPFIFPTSEDAEAALKGAIITSGVAMAHERLDRELPPWTRNNH